MNVKQIQIARNHSDGKARAKVLIIYTGGTFGMTHDKHGVLIPFDFASIIDHLPTIRNLGVEFSVFSFEKPIDSSNINPDHWCLIAKIIYDNHDSHDGFVVLHGTDTMAFTASALSFMLEGLSKPVILTGAQLPIIDPRSDARENLITALEIAAEKKDGRPVVPEVCIYFDYELLRGNRSKKVESMQFDAFDSGNYPPLAKAGVKIDYNFSLIRKTANKSLTLHDKFDSNLLILKLFPGMSQQAVESVFNAKGLRAVILETYGSGNAPTSPWLIEIIRTAIKNGIMVVNISQCPGGMVIQGKYETSKELQEVGVISGLDMTTEAAVTKLMVLMGQFDTNQCKELFSRNLAGELAG